MVKELISFFTSKISKSNWTLYFLLGFIIAFIDSVFLSTLYPFFKQVFFDESFVIEVNGITNNTLKNLIQFIESRFIYIFFVIVLFKGFLTFVEIYTAVILQQKFEYLNRYEIIKIYLGSAPKNLSSIDQGKSNNIFLNQINELKVGFRQFTMLLRKLSYLIIYFLFFIFIYKLYGLIIFSLLTFIPLIFYKIFNQTRSISKKKSNEDDKFGNNIFESISFLKYIISTDLTEKFIGRLKINLNELVSSNIRLGRNDAFIRSFREPIFISIILAIFFISNFFDLGQQNLLVSTLLAYRVSNYSFELYSSFNELLKSYGSVINQKKLTTNFDIGDPNGTKITSISSLEFSNVSFDQINSRLNHKINFKLKNFKKIIIIGESGSGKTTLINSLLKINKKYNGHIFINNTNIENISSKSIQKKIGFVSQEPIIFNDSIYNNISLWDVVNESNINKIKKLLISFNLERLYKDLCVDGINLKEVLSGGEKQRLNLIRELYKDPDLLLLDEVTSALDYESKTIIYKYLNQLKIKIILITHDSEILNYLNSNVEVIEIKNKN